MLKHKVEEIALWFTLIDEELDEVILSALKVSGRITTFYILYFEYIKQKEKSMINAEDLNLPF